jgi:hypothetical protein
MRHITIKVHGCLPLPLPLNIAKEFLEPPPSKGIWEQDDILKIQKKDFPFLSTHYMMEKCLCDFWTLELLSCFLLQAHAFITYANSCFDLDGPTPFWDLVCDAFAGGLKYREEHPISHSLIDFLIDMKWYKNICFNKRTKKWLFTNLKFFAVHGNDSIHAVIKCLMRDVYDFKNILVTLGDNGDYEFMFLLSEEFDSEDLGQDVTTEFVLTNSISESIFLWIRTIDEGPISRLQVKEYMKQTLTDRTSENETRHLRHWRKSFKRKRE